MSGMNNAQKRRNDRYDLIDQIKSYRASDDHEQSCINRFLDLLQDPRCFYRDCFPGHITGSALLMNKAGDQILLNHHKFLDKWVCFGGHADGDEDIANVAIRETEEESGLNDFIMVGNGFAELDIHPVPHNPAKNEPAHEHFDVRYIMRMCSDQAPVLSDESVALRWVTFDEAKQLLPKNDRLHHLINKAADYA